MSKNEKMKNYKLLKIIKNINILLNFNVLARFLTSKALRVLPAETRLTVYRRPRVDFLFLRERFVRAFVRATRACVPACK